MWCIQMNWLLLWQKPQWPNHLLAQKHCHWLLMESDLSKSANYLPIAQPGCSLSKPGTLAALCCRPRAQNGRSPAANRGCSGSGFPRSGCWRCWRASCWSCCPSRFPRCCHRRCLCCCWRSRCCGPRGPRWGSPPGSGAARASRASQTGCALPFRSACPPAWRHDPEFR